MALRELGCDHAQGFHFARPAPAAEVGELLASAELGELVA
jgi:EAL domain-containing protein (putative c-di-GMP-specific phosphodiesterase class I)